MQIRRCPLFTDALQLRDIPTCFFLLLPCIKWPEIIDLQNDKLPSWLGLAEPLPHWALIASIVSKKVTFTAIQIANNGEVSQLASVGKGKHLQERHTLDVFFLTEFEITSALVTDFASVFLWLFIDASVAVMHDRIKDRRSSCVCIICRNKTPLHLKAWI